MNDTYENLEDRNIKRLQDATRKCSEGDPEIPEDQKEIILKSMKSAERYFRLNKERDEDIGELLEIAGQQNYEFVEEQLEALKLAYIAYDKKAWGPCRLALEFFFNYETEADIKSLDLSGLSLRNLLRWLQMLEQTNMAYEPEWQAAITLQNMIEEQIANTFPVEIREVFKDGLRQYSPEVILMIKNAEIDKENRRVYCDVGYLIDKFDLSDEEVAKFEEWIAEFNRKSNESNAARSRFI